MKPQFRILSGARTGHAEVHSAAEIHVGRHPSCQLRFDPDRDLDVSGRHAVVYRTPKGWFVRDLQSRNGLLLNGHRVTTDIRIDDTDQLRFGADGPLVEFRLVADSVADTPPPVFAGAGSSLRPAGHSTVPRPDPPAASAGARPAGDRPGTTQRIRIEVARQTKKLKWVSLSLGAVLVLAVGGLLVLNQRQEAAREQEIAAIRGRSDSLLRASAEAVRALQGQMAGLASALQVSQEQVQRLQTALASAQVSGDRAQIAELRRQLDQANDVLRNQQVAAQVDYQSIARDHQRAVAIIYVRFPSDSVFTGTAFAVRSDDTGGVLITNRHVVIGHDGTQQPRDIGIQFADSRQVFPAQLLAVDPVVDLAAVRVMVAGGVPTVDVRDPRIDIAPGEPVAVIGFPLGVDLPMERSIGQRFMAKTTFTAGIVSKVLSDRIQIDGYGAEGASGSPIFDRRGGIVAILFGGEPGTGGRVVYGVPASHAIRLLQSIK